MLNTIKRYAGVMTMAVAAGVVTVPMMYGEQTRVTQTQTATVNWLEGDRLKGDLSPSEQEAALNRVQKHPYWKFIPKEIQQAIISNKENYSKVGVGSLIDSHRVCAYVNGFKRKQMTITVFPTMWQHIDIINAPVQTPAVNPKTGKPYVSVSPKVLVDLSPTDRSYIEQLTDRLNQNIHYLGNTPLPRLDLKRFKRGGYALSAVLPLTLHSSKLITDKYFMENNKVTKEEQLKNFGIEDPVAFDLGQRFLMPTPDPRLMYPLGYTGVGMECTREPRGGEKNMGSKIVANPIFLGWSYYIDKPDEISNVYKLYLEDSIKTVEFFMTKLNQEHAGIDKTTTRGQVEHQLLDQTEKIARQMQSLLEKELKTYKKTYKKPPRTLLDPSGKAYDAFVRKHGSSKPQAVKVMRQQQGRIKTYTRQREG